MSRPLILSLPVLLAAAPVAALTPEELWSAWQAQAQGFGLTLSAEAMAGPDGSLALRNWLAGEVGGPLTPPPADSPVQEVILRPQGDGSVLIELPGLPESGVIPGAADRMGDLRIEHDGLRIAARDGTDAIDYEIAAESLRVVTLAPPDEFATEDFAAEIWGLTLRMSGDIGPDRTVAAGLGLRGFAYVTNTMDAFANSVVSQAMRSEGEMSLAVTATIPAGLDFEEMEETSDFVSALEQGFALRLDAATGPGTQVASYTGFPFSYRYDSASGAGTGSFAFDRSGVLVSGEFGGGSATVTSPDLPFGSLDLSHGPMTTSMRLPFGAEVGEARYVLAFEDIVVGEAAWAALDPQGLLPREPASLRLDLAARMALDLGAMAAAEEAGLEAPPPAVESLELRELDVSVAGVRVSGQGSFPFDPAASVPLAGGSAEVTIEGVDRLLDALVEMGWVTAEDARNARLGMAAVFRPGPTPDSRVTSIEVREGGMVFANGIQMQ